ncbi:hypothetical protein FGADI_3378 [Fusarium gaditjirri]|uniref:Carboxyphosphonoenolpyruvate phosphonomutase-like protein n=1 Tax=Fusarium gaditjirri TaxID=282569 RepID=A0A8H4TFR2_9HYPO|nr:hypothetical protein FGADI_3378 [Fusarium gaditjirri]
MELIKLAQTLKSLHIPSQPLIFANVWDRASLNMVLCLNSDASKPVKAIATASWAFAASLGIKDEELAMEQNLALIRSLAPTVASAVAQAIQAGAHGANIEDSIPTRGLGQGIEKSLYPLNEQICRIKLAVRAAADAGLPDFVVNARCDIFALKDDLHLNNETRMKEAVRRGKAYLDAGATTVFFWRGYGTGFTEGDVQALVKELDGRVAIRLGQTRAALSASQLAKLGVARISIGTSLFQIAMNAAKKSAHSVLEGGRLEEI